MAQKTATFFVGLLIAGIVVGYIVALSTLAPDTQLVEQITILQTRLEEKENQISTLDKQIHSLQTQLQEKENQITAFNQEIQNLQTQIIELNKTLQNGLSEKDISDNSITVAKSLKKNGICYSPFRDGQNPNLGLFPTVEQIKEDMKFLTNITNCVRTYGSTNTLAIIPNLAKGSGLYVYQGVFLGRDPEVNTAEINSAVNLTKQGLVESVIIGNEVILLGVLTEDELIQYIRQAKQSMPEEVLITTAEAWSIWIDHPNLVNEVDYILAHVHPFWESQSIDNAATYVVERYTELKKKYPDKRIVIGETGWPSAGDPAWTGVSNWVIPSETNQQMFLEEFTQLAANNSIEYFLFEAFDEEWKWNERRSSGELGELAELRNRTFSGRVVGSSWGIFQSTGELKPYLSEFFKKIPLDSTRQIRDIYVGKRLSSEYDMGVDSSGGRTDWLSNLNGSMCMAYPAGQSWGAVFITVGKPKDPPRPWKDFSEFQTILIELKGEYGGESVEVGLKDACDPDDGSESKIKISSLSADWLTYEFPLSSFQTANLKKLYVVIEFVFTSSTAQTVYFRNIKYMP